MCAVHGYVEDLELRLLLTQDLPPTTRYEMLPEFGFGRDGLGDPSAAHVTRELHREKQSLQFLSRHRDRHLATNYGEPRQAYPSSPMRLA